MRMIHILIKQLKLSPCGIGTSLLKKKRGYIIQLNEQIRPGSLTTILCGAQKAGWAHSPPCRGRLGGVSKRFRRLIQTRKSGPGGTDPLAPDRCWRLFASTGYDRIGLPDSFTVMGAASHMAGARPSRQYTLFSWNLVYVAIWGFLSVGRQADWGGTMDERITAGDHMRSRGDRPTDHRL